MKNPKKMTKIKSCITLFFLLSLISIDCQDKPLAPNFNSLKITYLSDFAFCPRKEALTNLKLTNLSLLIDLKAGFKEDFTSVIKINQEKNLLYQHLDSILKDSNLYYHIDNKTLFISSEWYWLTIEEPYQVEYDVTNLYNEKKDLKEILTQLLFPFEMIKCKFEINFINSKQVAIIGNQYIHNYIKSILTNLRKPTQDYSQKSPQLIFPAEIYFKDQPLKISPASLSGKEWLLIIGQLNNIKVNFNNTYLNNILSETLFKIENENATTSELLKKITEQLKIKIHFQNDYGIFFDPDNMLKLAPIQKVQCKVYNVKHLTTKLNGTFICQNIKDELKKEVWVFPENQIIYHKHLEAIIVVCPPHLFPEIDAFFLKLSQKK
jgi:hypothetical protein